MENKFQQEIRIRGDQNSHRATTGVSKNADIDFLVDEIDTLRYRVRELRTFIEENFDWDKHKRLIEILNREDGYLSH